MSAMDTQPQLAGTHDEAAVRSLYAQLIEGSNAGSGAAFAAPFTDWLWSFLLRKR